MPIVCASDISAQCIIIILCPAFPGSVCHANTTHHDRMCKISGLWCSVDVLFAVLACYVVYVGSCFVKGQGGQEEFLQWYSFNLSFTSS
jgi:hypothetical protein